MSTEYQVHALTFDGTSMLIQFIQLPEDVRVSGAVVMQRQLAISLAHPDYAEDADKLQRMAVRVLKNALEDFNDSPPYVPEEEDDDDELGMGER